MSLYFTFSLKLKKILSPNFCFSHFRQDKYNEYCNIIRVSSEKFRAARDKSSSRASLFTVADYEKTEDNKHHTPLRNAVSLEAGMDSKHKKQTKGKKKDKTSGQEDGSKKPKKHFSFKKFREFFMNKKKHKGDKSLKEENDLNEELPKQSQYVGYFCWYGICACHHF